MILDHYSLQNCGWINSADTDRLTTLASRVRLARNLSDTAFSNWADTATLVRVRDRIVEVLHNVLDENEDLPDFDYINLDDVSELDRTFLAERNLISREMAQSSLPRTVAISHDETISLMVNEEDHLRMQCILPVDNLRNAWQTLNHIDDLLSEQLDYAFSPRWGFLTACPTNTGTGLRAGVMLHLPALVIARQIEPVLKAIQTSGMVTRGLGGEGVDISGNIFQVSNQATLGLSESDTLQDVEAMVERLLSTETNAEEELLGQARTALEDHVWRAYGILGTAHAINTEEARRQVSMLRLGIATGILDRVSLQTANEILFCTGPAHLQKRYDEPLEDQERDQKRAEFIREKIGLL